MRWVPPVLGCAKGRCGEKVVGTLGIALHKTHSGLEHPAPHQRCTFTQRGVLLMVTPPNLTTRRFLSFAATTT